MGVTLSVQSMRSLKPETMSWHQAQQLQQGFREASSVTEAKLSGSSGLQVPRTKFGHFHWTLHQRGKILVKPDMTPTHKLEETFHCLSLSYNEI